MFPLPIRLNNPGAIEKNSIDWQGATMLQDHDRFVRFKTPRAGIRALMKVLVNYKKIHNINTIEDVIHRWAPPFENDTGSYISDVSMRTGMLPVQPIDLEDPMVLIHVAMAIVMHENGAPPKDMPQNWYEDEMFIGVAAEVLEGW